MKRQANTFGPLRPPKIIAGNEETFPEIRASFTKNVTTRGRELASTSASVIKFVIFRNPYRGTGQAPFEIRDGLIDGATIERCLTRREAESVADTLSTKSRKQTVEDVLQ